MSPAVPDACSLSQPGFEERLAWIRREIPRARTCRRVEGGMAWEFPADPELRDKLEENTKFFREQMTAAGFDIVPGDHPITPIMLGDAKLAVDMAARMMDEGVYVIGFSFPVVPQGKARIRTQISAAHTREDLEFAIVKFGEVKTELEI